MSANLIGISLSLFDKTLNKLFGGHVSISLILSGVE